MGACVSVHRSSDSAMKLRLSFGSKNDKLGIPPSPVKEKPASGECRIKDVALKSWSPSPSAKTLGDYGSKEEAFFDSHPWLESDCEDDFYSVNGDFTPSRGNTPVHQGFPIGSSRVNKPPFEDKISGPTIPTPSPTEKKKRLLELFQESTREDKEEVSKAEANGALQAKQAGLDLPSKSGRGTPFLSGANSACSSSEKRTPIGDVLQDEEEPMRSAHCCLPSLISCRSFSDRKKKMSPAIAVNDRP